MVIVKIQIKILFIFSTPVIIRCLWQLKTVVVLHWCLICIVIFWPYFQHTYSGRGHIKGSSHDEVVQPVGVDVDGADGLPELRPKLRPKKYLCNEDWSVAGFGT